MRIPIAPFDRGRHWTPVKSCPYGEGHARFGRVTIVVTMTRYGHKIVAKNNRKSDSESPDDLIPNNILRAQTTRKRTASVITAIRWNTL